MKRLVVLAACVVLISAACKKSSEAPANQPASQPAAAAGGPSAPPDAAKPAEPAEPKKIEITDAMVLKFMEYQKENIALIRQYAAESKKNLESAKGDTAKALNQMSIADKMTKEMDATLEAKRQSLGLGQDEFDLLKDAVQTVATSRAVYNQMGGDAQVATMVAQQKAEIAKLPPEQRPAAEAQSAEMLKNFNDMKNGADVRKKYGDQNADVILKHADELAKLYWDSLKEAGGKK
jgi:hypothetical protein